MAIPGCTDPFLDRIRRDIVNLIILYGRYVI
jgi:hypothetical protein